MPPTPSRMAARTPPVDALRDRYAGAGVTRYEDALTDHIDHALDQTDPEDTDPSTLAAAIAAWVAARQRATGVRPTAAQRADWIDDVVEQAYRDGITHARDALRDAGVAMDRSTPDARLNQPAHRGAIQALRVDQREAWQRLAADLEDDIAQAVRQTARDGATRAEIADTIRERVTHVGEHRASLIGETEPSRAFHRAALEEWALNGVTSVRVDWVTAGDHRVCPSCRAGSAGSPYSIEEARGLIPHHPRCRCTWEPVQDSMEGPRR